jgi:hypothetical protein
MDKVIVAKIPDGGCHIVVAANSFFNVNSERRKRMAAQGIFNESTSNDEIMEWVRNKYAPSYRSLLLRNERNEIIESDDDAKKRLGVNDLDVIMPHRIVERAKLPDRYFRNAWTDHNPSETVDVNMEKARPIHMDKLRIMRQKKFEQLGFKDKPSPEVEKLLPKELQDQLQALRDIPQVFDLSVSETPEQLKAMIPDQLKS